MTNCAELDIILTRHDLPACRVELRIRPAGSETEQAPQPGIAHIPFQTLLELQPQPDAYGRTLAAAIFADESVRSAFGNARVAAETARSPLQIRLLIPFDDGQLQGLLWETLADPQRNSPLFSDEQVRFTRYLSSDDWTPVTPLPRGDLTALLAVAAPTDLADYNLAGINAAKELERARAALDDIPAVALDGPVTLNALIDRIHVERPDIVYLVAHGRLAPGGPTLWLENDTGTSAPVKGSELATRLAEHAHKPRLMVLASCQSAGAGDSGDGGALTASGPLLARAGVPAVVAMHGSVSVETVAQFMPIFLRELRDDGQIDRAMAVARSTVRGRSDWWMPVLFSRLRSGRLWSVETASRAEPWQFRIVPEISAPGQVTVRATWKGRPAASPETVPLTAPPEQLQQQFIAAGPGDGAASERALIDLGRALGKIVFPGALADALSAALEEARAAGQALDLLFDIADDGLLALPLEAARLPDGRAPALLAGVHVMRRLAGQAGATAAATPLAGPLRILAAVAAPDENQTRSTPLDRERELQTLMDVVELAGQRDGARVTVLEVAHPHQIRDALLAQSYHVLHLSGHGSPRWIEMEDEDGAAVPVFAEDLADALRAGGRTVPLVFLSTCHGAVGDPGAASFAASLLSQGVPQVVAMQRSVSDWYATRLAGAFYARLGSMATPLASHALALARQEVEGERLAALSRGQRPPGLPGEYATATLFSAATGDEQPLIDRALPPEPPQPQAELPYAQGMPLLKIGDLIGRRPELRRLMRALLDDPRAGGPWSGALIQGMGGAGKSALAGRIMERLSKRGWTVVAVVGRWGLGELAVTIGGQLAASRDEELARLGGLLSQPVQSDQVRLQALARLLAQHRFLLVLDNFEDNLTLLGRDFADETSALVLETLLAAARRGKLLLTSRYPLPDGLGDGLAAVHLGPLSLAETLRFFHRLPALAGADAAAVSAVLRQIGGHPRSLEYLDALLRRAPGRLPHLSRHLRSEAKRQGVDLRQLGGDLDSALRDATQLAAGNILLDALLAEFSGAPDDLELLFQAAVYPAPVALEGLIFAPAGTGPPDETAVAAARDGAERLAASSLLTPTGDGHVFVHRWTAESLRQHSPEDAFRARCRRAGEYLLWRMATASRDLGDALEAVRLLLAAEAWDRATEIAWQVVPVLRDYGQTIALAGFLAEVVAALPTDFDRFPGLCRECGDAFRALGMGREVAQYYQSAMEASERLAAAEPDRADYQRDLSVSYERMGDLFKALGQGEQARQAFQRSLDIRERLAAAEPDRADAAWDLVVSLYKVAQIDEDHNRELLSRALTILRRLYAAGSLYPNQVQAMEQLEEMLGAAEDGA